MKAATHTEVYRPFRGKLRSHPVQSATLAWSGIRVGFRKKLPALFLFVFPAILTIVTSFMIQLKFDAEAGNVVGLNPNQGMAVGALLSDQLGATEELILVMLDKIKFFIVLVIGWYGSGLIAEDRRLRANLLYFARPMTRRTYTLGKLGTVMFWGMCAVAAPTTVMCGTACFASPDWSFLTEKWDTILKLEAYAVLNVFVHGLLVLAISSLVDKRNHALAGLFGVYILSSMGSEAIAGVLDGTIWRLGSVPANFERLSEWMFDRSTGRVEWPIEATLWALGLLVLGSIATLSIQTRKMELGR